VSDAKIKVPKKEFDKVIAKLLRTAPVKRSTKRTTGQKTK
jgi:hypothetical protein